jgi:hypothetical protein
VYELVIACETPLENGYHVDKLRWWPWHVYVLAWRCATADRLHPLLGDCTGSVMTAGACTDTDVRHGSKVCRDQHGEVGSAVHVSAPRPPLAEFASHSSASNPALGSDV